MNKPDGITCLAETGAGLAELTGLLPEDIKLDAEILHIAIVPRTKKALKTKFRARNPACGVCA